MFPLGGEENDSELDGDESDFSSEACEGSSTVSMVGTVTNTHVFSFLSVLDFFYKDFFSHCE